MEKFNTITQILRTEFLETYRNLQNEFNKSEYSDDDDTDFFEDDDIEENELEDSEENNVFDIDKEILCDLAIYTRNHEFKNLLYLIMFNDVYEYIKVNQICDNTTFDYEIKILNFLETFSINELIDKVDSSCAFLVDVVRIFTEYQIYYTKNEKTKSRKILELTNNIKNINKFKICILDDIQKQYTKTKKIY